MRWIEARGRDRAASVSTVPLDLAPILREDLFRRATTTVVTSATLATDGRFDFLTSRLGLDDPELEPRTGIYPVAVQVSRAGDPRHPERRAARRTSTPPATSRRVARLTLDLAEASDGGMFVLFTSHRDVRAMAAELRARGVGAALAGARARRRIARRRCSAAFATPGGAILLGTASFWEGVDVPGDALRALLIAKLPFRVPTEPITAAHCEAIAARGGDPFREYMLPHAALRLKQGFGRLIRTQHRSRRRGDRRSACRHQERTAAR